MNLYAIGCGLAFFYCNDLFASASIHSTKGPRKEAAFCPCMEDLSNAVIFVHYTFFSVVKLRKTLQVIYHFELHL
jgi:hypothetical protein